MHLLLGPCGEEQDAGHLPLVSVVTEKERNVQLVSLHLSAESSVTLKHLRLTFSKLTSHITCLDPKNINFISPLLFQVPNIATIISDTTLSQHTLLMNFE